MKLFKISGNVFKCLLLVGILASCNHDDVVNPIQTTDAQANNQNAKISSLTRLTKDGDVSIQYIKSGKFFGKVSKLFTGPNDAFNFEYSYDDNNPQGILWITRKQIKKSDGTLLNINTYKVVNGLCVFSTQSDGSHHEYLYTPQGQLSEVNKFKNGSKIGSVSFSYNYNSATNSYRLHTLTVLGGGGDFELTYTYTSIPDKYPLRNPLVVLPTSVEHGNMDAHLPIFGKFSDVLVDIMVGQFLVGGVPHNYKFTYTTDSDGLVISKTQTVSSGNNPPTNPQTWTQKYSDAWQGI